MKSKFHTLAIIAALAFICGRVSPCAAADRYWAMLRDGTMLSENQLPHWDSARRDVRFAGRSLFDAGNPVRIICDTTVKPALTPPFVVMANGDVLPGVIDELLGDSNGLGLPPRLLVHLQGVVAANDESRLLVRADRVARVVTTHRRRRDSPDPTLLLRSGREVPCRAVRWLGTVTKQLDHK